jgi:hypothetical protein
MCPACISIAAMLAAGTATAGGIAALMVHRFRQFSNGGQASCNGPHNSREETMQ